MYFLVDRIVGRQDFDAADDITAIRIARVLCEACFDICQSFELWEGTRIVRTRPPPFRTMSDIAGFNDAAQRAVIESEEAIQQSQWRIAESRRLVARLEAARGSVPSTPPLSDRPAASG